MKNLSDPEKGQIGLADLSQADAAAYIHDLLHSLQKVASNRELPLLVHLLALAKSEAKRCSS